jgi:hypothetical protein
MVPPRLWWNAVVAWAILVAGCSDPDEDPYVCTVVTPTDCAEPVPTYTEVIAPIFERRCVTCHSGEENGPWPLTSYQHAADWWDIVRDQLLHCSMPPADSGVRMTTEERTTVLKWVRCGFPE